MTTALFIGRFQPFHNGHLWALNQILIDCDHILIGIGSSQYKNTEENPYSYEERELMIKRALKENNISNYSILPIPDTNDCDLWIPNTIKIINDNNKKFDIVYSGSPITKTLFSDAGYRVKDIPRNNNLSSTEIRELVKNKDMHWHKLVPKAIVEFLENKNY